MTNIFVQYAEQKVQHSETFYRGNKNIFKKFNATNDDSINDCMYAQFVLILLKSS